MINKNSAAYYYLGTLQTGLIILKFGNIHLQPKAFNRAIAQDSGTDQMFMKVSSSNPLV
jgi:hypothetical protein